MGLALFCLDSPSPEEPSKLRPATLSRHSVLYVAAHWVSATSLDKIPLARIGALEFRNIVRNTNMHLKLIKQKHIE